MPTARVTAAFWLSSLFLRLSAADNFNFYDEVLSHPPNETRPISFKPFPEDPDLGDSEWTWHVNITDVALPNAKITYPQAGDGSPDSRGLVVSYDLVWPEWGVLSDTLSRYAPHLCAAVPITVSRLPNVTNAWPEDNTESPDCAPVLGKACVDAILETAAKSNDESMDIACRLGTSWDLLPECKDVLYEEARPVRDYGSRDGWIGSITRGIMPVESGETINGGLMNYVYDGKNTSSLYESAVTMLHILLLHSTPPPKSNVSAREPFLACMRVKTDKLPVRDDTENGNGEGEDQQQGGGGSAAPYGAQANLLAAGGAFILAMIMGLGL
ncbi:hypothetical protein V8F33_011842 [Rhypophila sp. PSN 637]